MILPRIAFTIGDINGIGPEVLARALRHPGLTDRCRPAIIANRRLVHEYFDHLPDIATDELDRFEWIEIDSTALLNPGCVDAEAGRLAGRAIERAVRLVIDGRADAIVTMPISKEGLNAGGFPYPGHTEMLATLSGGGDPLMILMTHGLRVALATIHVPIIDVPRLLNPAILRQRIRQFHESLRIDFSIERPRIAVLALNPHAGEGGGIGREEIDWLGPTLEAVRSDGLNVQGPLPADGFFARYEPGSSDGVLAMYHDQGLIPLKMMARGAGVNFTASLPIVRTSPDHGTAYDITMCGVADERSVVEAVNVAIEVVRNRSLARRREGSEVD